MRRIFGLRKLATVMAGLALAVAVAALAVTLRQGDSSDSSANLTRVERTQMENLVREYILDNPEIITEAVQILQQRETEAEQAKVESAAKVRWSDIASDGHSPVAGPEDAPVTVVEFYDYRCSFCRRAYPDVAKLLKTYEGEIRYVFKQFPVLDGPNNTSGISHTAARAAVAAAGQDMDKFRDFHDRMMRREGKLTKQRVFDMAETAGLDVAALKNAMGEESIDRYFTETLALARDIGISGTPTYVINGRVLAGARGFDAMKELVEKGLQDGA